MKYMEPYSVAWEAMANRIARLYVPNIYPCFDCGGPVVQGYCCQRCGSDDPENTERRERPAHPKHKGKQ